jgi:NTP pyrophosphatase (non-canonical NTP hydrolase)
MSDLTLKQMQKDVDGWVMAMGGYFTPLSQLAQLTEEVGELARLINRVHGDQSFKKGEKDESEIPNELADILFTLNCLANTLKVDLETAITANMEKKRTRDAQRKMGNLKLAG